MKKHIKGVSLSILAIGFCLLLQTHAYAQQAPFVEEFDIAEVNTPVANCGDFIMIADGEGTAKLTTYFNRQGDPIRLLFQGRYNGTLSNSVTGASIADAPSVANIFVDLVAGTQTNIGAFFTVTVPGEGVVFFEAGRIVFAGAGEPVFIAGPHLPPDESTAILCSALR